MKIKVDINDKVEYFESIENFKNMLKEIEHREFNEIWISGHGQSNFSLLTNKNSAFVMYLREEGDSGFSSRSSQQDSIEYEEFMLSNGQLDEYPKN